MNARELFTAGVRLIGVYVLIAGVTSLPVLLRVIDAHRDWGDYRSSLMLVLTIALQVAVGLYLIGGAPWVIKSAGYGSPDEK